MTTLAPDSFDFERSRAAVAVACLQWLRCTGPAIRIEPVQDSSSDIADPRIFFDSNDLPHPLWDQWLDGRGSDPRWLPQA